MRKFIDVDIVREHLLSRIDFDPIADRNLPDGASGLHSFQLFAQRGFLARPIADDGLEVLGLHTPRLEPGEELPEIIRPTTELADLPPEERHVDIVGKGVGERLCNTWFAALCQIRDPRPKSHNGTEYPQTGLYGVEVSGKDALWFAAKDGQLAQSAIGKVREHRAKRRQALTAEDGLNAVVEEVHGRMGDDAELAIWGCPPRALLRGWTRGLVDRVAHRSRRDLQPRFAVIRSGAMMRRYGSVRTDS